MMNPKTWAVIADGAHAIFLKEAGAAKPGEEMEMSRQIERAGEIMADEAGRSFSSAGARRSAMEPHSDPVRERERGFATEIAACLKKHLDAGDFEKLIIFSAPETLGDLRKVMHDSVKQSVVREVAKNLTKLPRKELWETVRNEMLP